MRDQNPVVRGKNFKEVGELILIKSLKEKAQKAKDLNEVLSFFCLFEIGVNMIKFVHQFDLRKSLKIQWHKAKVSNH
jgi:hypothetical protein